MSTDNATGKTPLAGPSPLQDDIRRVGLVGGVALAALAVIALAWTATPPSASSVSTSALGIGAVGVLSVSTLTLGAAWHRTHRQLAGHAALFEESRTSAGPETGTMAATEELTERLEALEGRLGTVEQMQNDHLVGLIEATDPPQANGTVETRS